ncbi:MAG TPA: hypothetical protein VJ784_08585 [Pyrinomonadaceae bacterium]|nr:hypothetical protein [Pyrinomonadaceae bacterium]
MTDASSHSMQHSVDPAEPDPNFVKWLKENCVPIVGIVVGALVLCLIAHYSSATVDWTRTKDFAQAFASVTQSLALIAGGVWAYFKFAKGRTFRDRLNPAVSGKLVSIDGSVFLIVTIRLQNVGLSRIAFDQDVSSLAVFEFVPSQTGELLSLENNQLATFRVFRDTDRYIEPNEIVERQTMIALSKVSDIGYQLEFQVFSDSGYKSRAMTIVDKSAFCA